MSLSISQVFGSIVLSSSLILGSSAFAQGAEEQSAEQIEVLAERQAEQRSAALVQGTTLDRLKAATVNCTSTYSLDIKNRQAVDQLKQVQISPEGEVTGPSIDAATYDVGTAGPTLSGSTSDELGLRYSLEVTDNPNYSLPQAALTATAPGFPTITTRGGISKTNPLYFNYVPRSVAGEQKPAINGNPVEYVEIECTVE